MYNNIMWNYKSNLSGWDGPEYYRDRAEDIAEDDHDPDSFSVNVMLMSKWEPDDKDTVEANQEYEEYLQDR